MGLKGAKIGVFKHASKRFYESQEYDSLLFDDVIQTLHEEGALVIEDIEIPSFHRGWKRAVLPMEMKHSLENYLFKLPSHLPVHSIADLIQFNICYADKALKYGQNKLEEIVKLPNTLRNHDYLNAKLDDLYFSQTGIDFALKKYDLDAILFPSYIGSTICAKAGYPSIALPAGYKKSGRPFGITFAGTAFSEGRLIKLAYAFEQASKHRKSPKLK